MKFAVLFTAINAPESKCIGWVEASSVEDAGNALGIKPTDPPGYFSLHGHLSWIHFLPITEIKSHEELLATADGRPIIPKQKGD